MAPTLVQNLNSDKDRLVHDEAGESRNEQTRARVHTLALARAATPTFARMRERAWSTAAMTASRVPTPPPWQSTIYARKAASHALTAAVR